MNIIERGIDITVRALLNLLAYPVAFLFTVLGLLHEQKRDIGDEIARESRDNIHTRSGM